MGRPPKITQQMPRPVPQVKLPKRPKHARGRAPGAAPIPVEAMPTAAEGGGLSQVEWARANCAAICAAIAAGGTTLHVCRDAGINTITWSTACRRWPSVAAAYREAVGERARTWAEETIRIADDADDGGPDGARVRIAARQWAAARGLPTEYGDRREIAVQSRSVVVHVVTGVPSPDAPLLPDGSADPARLSVDVAVNDGDDDDHA